MNGRTGDGDGDDGREPGSVHGVASAAAGGGWMGGCDEQVEGENRRSGLDGHRELRAATGRSWCEAPMREGRW